MSWRRLCALNPVSRAREKRASPFIRAARNSGVANGYLPSSTVKGSPSTIKVWREPTWPSRGARSRKRESMRSTQRSGGSIWWQSASRTFRPLRMVVSSSSEMPGNRSAEPARAGRTALVGRERASLGVHAGDRFLEPPRGGTEAEVLEHHDRREDRGRRVDDVAAGDVGRRAVNGLEVGVGVAVAAARSEAEAADEPRRGVGEDVAVEIRQHDHVELVR